MTWQTALDLIKTQTTPATFDQHLRHTCAGDPVAGRLTVTTPSEASRAWLDVRLRSVVERVVASVYCADIVIEFVVADGGGLSPNDVFHGIVESVLPNSDPQPSPPADSPAQRLASVDFSAVWTRTGYAMLSHYAAYFWQPYLDAAFTLWKRLDADSRIPTDRRDIRQAGNRWSPPLRYYYREMARMVGKQHYRVIAGGEVECWQSMLGRRNEQPLEACCGNPDFQPVRVRPSSDNCARCMHWQIGLLEVLYREHLVAIALAPGQRRANRLELQVWRLLPVLTPAQLGRLNDSLRTEHDMWLEGSNGRPALGHALDLDLAEWEAIEEPTLVPLMVGYEDGRKLWDTFEPDRDFLEYAEIEPSLQVDAPVLRHACTKTDTADCSSDDDQQGIQVDAPVLRHACTKTGAADCE